MGGNFRRGIIAFIINLDIICDRKDERKCKMKTSLIMAFVLIISNCFTSNLDGYNLKKIKWGMTKKSVKKLEKGRRIFKVRKNEISYLTKFDRQEVKLKYYFKANRLTKISILLIKYSITVDHQTRKPISNKSKLYDYKGRNVGEIDPSNKLLSFNSSVNFISKKYKKKEKIIIGMAGFHRRAIWKIDNRRFGANVRTTPSASR